MDLHLTGNTALITASSSGIGLAIASTFLEEGANIIINGRENNMKKGVNDREEYREQKE